MRFIICSKYMFKMNSARSYSYIGIAKFNSYFIWRLLLIIRLNSFNIKNEFGL